MSTPNSSTDGTPDTDGPGFKLHLTFDDEFTNGFQSSPDGSVGWMTKLPDWGDDGRTLWGNHEAQYYSDPSVGENPFSVSHGVLSITATPAAPGTTPEGQAYRSGAITTFGSFAQTYGYFAVRAELPAGQGLWPAFWLLPANNVYSSELDVFEQLGNDPNTIYSTTHGETGPNWVVNFNPIHVPNVSTSFHTYGVDWEPTTTTFYFDGHKTVSVPTPGSLNSPMYMILNLAVGGQGSWPGADTSTAPASMKIAWVRAYATAATRDVSGSAAITSTSGLSAAPTLNGAAALSASDWTAGSLTAAHSTAASASTKVTTSTEHALSTLAIQPHAHSTSQSHAFVLNLQHMT